MKPLREVDPEIFDAILAETQRQHSNLELIASENFASESVLEAQGSVLTNKYAEGYPGKRWYSGCEHVDTVERLAIERAKQLFGAEHANVQPHSGTQANIAVQMALLEPGDTMMAMDLACGGHLSHGHPLNFSGRYFNIVPYGLSRETELLDFDEIASKAREHKPKLILAGYTAYPREIPFGQFREIADEVGAALMVDIAHISGLVATGLHPDPVPLAEVVTTTTHKTLRGPRGGLILCRESLAKRIDREVFPGGQGGPLEHTIAAKAVALHEALQPSFREYQQQVVANARRLAEALSGLGYRIISGGTDNHMMLVDVLGSKGVTGKAAAAALDRARITANKNLIPFDEKSPAVGSGVRLGTPAVTTRGMTEAEMDTIAAIIDQVLSAPEDENTLKSAADRVVELTEQFPLYSVRRGVMLSSSV